MRSQPWEGHAPPVTRTDTCAIAHRQMTIGRRQCSVKARPLFVRRFFCVRLAQRDPFFRRPPFTGCRQVVELPATKGAHEKQKMPNHSFSASFPGSA